jgi:hypothetical protein
MRKVSPINGHKICWSMEEKMAHLDTAMARVHRGVSVLPRR